MFYFTGLPGFLFLAQLMLPWSLLSIVCWSTLGWVGLHKIDYGEKADIAVFVRGIAATLLILAGVVLSLATRSWPLWSQALVIFGSPTLLSVLALSAAKDHAKRGKNLIARLVPIFALQSQLMLLGFLIFMADVFTGGSPI